MQLEKENCDAEKLINISQILALKTRDQITGDLLVQNVGKNKIIKNFEP
jgi:hypothetical protein